MEPILSVEIRAQLEVAQLFFLGGSDDFLIHVRVYDSDHAREFVLKHLSVNPAIASTPAPDPHTVGDIESCRDKGLLAIILMFQPLTAPVHRSPVLTRGARQWPRVRVLVPRIARDHP